MKRVPLAVLSLAALLAAGAVQAQSSQPKQKAVPTPQTNFTIESPDQGIFLSTDITIACRARGQEAVVSNNTRWVLPAGTNVVVRMGDSRTKVRLSESMAPGKTLAVRGGGGDSCRAYAQL
jgi:hypothetical protein